MIKRLGKLLRHPIIAWIALSLSLLGLVGNVGVGLNLGFLLAQWVVMISGVCVGNCLYDWFKAKPQ